MFRTGKGKRASSAEAFFSPQFPITNSVKKPVLKKIVQNNATIMASEALELHSRLRGKIEVIPKLEAKDKKLLSLIYTPGVAEPCLEISKGKGLYDYTMKGNSVAIVSDGSAVLGLGNIGAEAAIPVMEGKAVLFKQFAGINAFPICIKTQDTDKIVEIVENISPVFGGINIEDISAPRCFEIEKRLQNIGIPVMHDDQHATAIVTLAALINSSAVLGKSMESMKVAINGAGAAGSAIARFLLCFGDDKSRICRNVKDVVICDSKGAIYRGREGLEGYKKELAELTNKGDAKGQLDEVIVGADVFIGVSKGNALKKEAVASMAEDPIVFALANPVPEILPKDALEAGAKIVATGRSDFPNQVNNALAFPGVFRGLLDSRAERVTNEMKIAAAIALAGTIKKPTTNEILPSVFDKNVVKNISAAIKECR